MDILISVVGKVAEYTVAPIGRQAGYLIFYKGNFKELADHVKELEAARERMNHLVEEEKGNGKEIYSDVLDWLKEVNDVIEKANQLKNNPHRVKAGCSGWSFPNLILRHQFSRKATKIAKEVDQVQGKREKGKFDRVGYLPTPDGVGATRGGEKLETRELFKEEIMKALKDPNACNIGVYGLGGMGKTTLVKEVAEIAKQQQLFDVVVIAHVSKTPDQRNIIRSSPPGTANWYLRTNSRYFHELVLPNSPYNSRKERTGERRRQWARVRLRQQRKHRVDRGPGLEGEGGSDGVVVFALELHADQTLEWW